MSEDIRPKRWKRWLKRALLAFVLLLALAVILHQTMSYRAAKALQRELDAIRAAGDPLTLEELWPPEITPESENAAFLYQAASDLLIACGFEEAEPALQEENAWDADPAQWPQEAVANLRRLVEECEQPLQLIRRAAQMEHCRFDPGLTFPGTVSTEHLVAPRRLARIICWSARLRLHDGDTDGALADCRTALAVSRALDNEPLVICLLVRLALIGMALRTTEDVVKKQQPARETCEDLLADLAGVPASLREQLANAYKGERVVSRTFMAPFLGQWDILPLEMRANIIPWYTRGRIARFVSGPFLRSEEASMHEVIRRLIEIAPRDYVDSLPQIGYLRTDAEEWTAHPYRHWSRIFAAMLAPTLLRAKEEETKGEARIALAQVAFALKLHKAEHREYPDSLDRLAPDILERVPLDPFTAGPLKYAQDGDGFSVYSVGLNGVDDGGLTEFEQDGETIDPGTDDIAWRCAQ